MRIFWKICRAVLWAVLAVAVLDAGTIAFFSFYRPEIKKADAIVILGAAINTPALYNRSLQGLKLYQEGDANQLVLSGGEDYPKSIPEAEYMQGVILNNATTVPQMVLEEDSHSTYDNIKNTKAKIGSGKSLIIVSDSFHLARGVLVALREGFYPVYWSSPPPSYYNKRELLYYYGREFIAMLDYIPKFIFG